MAQVSITNPAGDEYIKQVANGVRLDSLRIQVSAIYIDYGDQRNISSVQDTDTNIFYLHPITTDVETDGSFTFDLTAVDTAYGYDKDKKILLQPNEVDSKSVWYILAIEDSDGELLYTSVPLQVDSTQTTLTLTEFINSSIVYNPPPPAFSDKYLTALALDGSNLVTASVNTAPDVTLDLTAVAQFAKLTGLSLNEASNVVTAVIDNNADVTLNLSAVAQFAKLSGLSLNPTTNVVTATVDNNTDVTLDFTPVAQFAKLTGLSLNDLTNVITATISNNTDVTVDLSTIAQFAKLSGLSFNSTSGILTATISNNTDVTVDLSALWLMLSDANNNLLVGTNALGSITTGSGNTAVGTNALEDVTTSSNNTAIGINALKDSTGSRNIGIGELAGVGAELVPLSGNDNISVGSSTVPDMTTGSNNVSIGSGSGAGVADGNNNFMLGSSSNVDTGNDSNKFVLAHGGASPGDQKLITGEFDTGDVDIPNGNLMEQGQRVFSLNNFPSISPHIITIGAGDYWENINTDTGFQNALSNVRPQPAGRTPVYQASELVVWDDLELTTAVSASSRFRVSGGYTSEVIKNDSVDKISRPLLIINNTWDFNGTVYFDGLNIEFGANAELIQPNFYFNNCTFSSGADSEIIRNGTYYFKDCLLDNIQFALTDDDLKVHLNGGNTVRITSRHLFDSATPLATNHLLSLWVRGENRIDISSSNLINPSLLTSNFGALVIEFQGVQKILDQNNIFYTLDTISQLPDSLIYYEINTQSLIKLTQGVKNYLEGDSVGTVKMTAGSTLPNGWLNLDGQAVDRTTYSALFNEIGVVYGIGDGSTTFNLPDMRSRIPIGVGAGTGLSTYALGDANGSESTTEVIGHTHTATIKTGTDSGTYTDTANDQYLGTSAGGEVYTDTPNTGESLNAGAVVVAENSGGATSINLRQPSLAINYIIKY